MRSVKELQDAAEKERNLARADRAAGQKHRQKANDIKVGSDQNLVLRETEQAQAAEEKAQVHEKAAADFIKEATDLEQKAIEADRELQTEQVESQRKIERLQDKAKRLRGE